MLTSVFFNGGRNVAANAESQARQKTGTAPFIELRLFFLGEIIRIAEAQ